MLSVWRDVEISHWICCCRSGDCLFFEDDYNRADNTDTGPYDEISGNWEVKSNQLWEEGNAGAKIICTRLIDPGQMYVSVYAIDPQVGDVYIVYVDWVDTTTYHYAQFTLTSVGHVTVSLYDHSSGSDTLIATKNQTYADPDKMQMFVCIGDGSFRATVQATEEYPWEELTPHGGRRFGMGHGCNHEVNFDDLEVLRLRTAKIQCQTCRCSCLQNVVSKTLTATFSASGAKCDCMDGETITLNWEWNGGAERWVGSGGTQGFSLVFQCSADGDADPDWPGKNFALTVNKCYQPGISGASLPYTSPAQGSSTCSPLSLVFGTWHVSDSDLTCFICGSYPLDGKDCDYYITVTE